MEKKPNGFVATCQCGNVVGAMDFRRTERKEAGRIMGQWLADGCTIEPRFSESWSVSVTACNCK